MAKSSTFHRSREGERGQVLIFVGVLLVGLFALSGFALDVGYALEIRRELQASTDAAALAGAQDLPNGTTAIATARTYSSITAGKNIRSNHPSVTMVSGYPLTKCLTSMAIPCTATQPNAIVVKQQTDVPTFFAKVIGWNSLTMKASATASVKGGVPKALDVMLVVDTTASMNSACTATVAGVSGPSRLDCATAGARSLLSGLWPCAQGISNCTTANSVDEVGLMVFPGLTGSAQVSKEFDCNSNISSSNIAAYNASPTYLVAPLSHDFRTSSTAALNGGNSNIVKAVDWTHGNGCTSSAYGLESPGGVGTYFADVITQAQTRLNASSRPTAQKVIIVLSDGDATYTGVSDPCQTAINAADAAAAAGTWIYSIAYGASSSSSNSCTNDSPKISALTTMQRLASDDAKFFNQPTAGDLTNIFNQIAVSLTGTRLVPDSTQ